MAAWQNERELRIAFEQRPSATGLDVNCQSLTPGQPVTIGDLEIEPVLVEHGPVTPAFGFVLRSGGKTAVLSGYTGICDALISAGQCADLLVHEVYLHQSMKLIPGKRSAATVKATASYHTLSSEVGDVAQRMGVHALALTHFVLPVFDRAAWLAEVAGSFDGPIFIGEDLMSFDLTSGNVALENFHARLV